jgi:hypothetical protein
MVVGGGCASYVDDMHQQKGTSRSEIARFPKMAEPVEWGRAGWSCLSSSYELHCSLRLSVLLPS